MRKYRRNLKRSHQAKPRHVGGRHRRDVLTLVSDLPSGGFQEFGQQIETSRLAGPVRTNQRVNAAAADPKVDIANGKETREFLRQSLGFENEIIRQSNSPISPQATPRRAWPTSICPGRFAKTSWNSPWTRRLRAGICRQRPSLRKAESSEKAAHG